MSLRRRTLASVAALVLAATTAAVVSLTASPASAATYSAYVMGYFTESPSGTPIW